MELNKDHYAREIVDIALKGGRVALVDNKPVACNVENCERCSACDGKYIDKLMEWGYEVYKKPTPKLSEAEIEELTYYFHHGYNYIVGVGTEEDFKIVIQSPSLKDVVAFETYQSLDPTQLYVIQNLLEDQNEK